MRTRAVALLPLVMHTAPPAGTRMITQTWKSTVVAWSGDVRHFVAAFWRSMANVPPPQRDSRTADDIVIPKCLLTFWHCALKWQQLVNCRMRLLSTTSWCDSDAFSSFLFMKLVSVLLQRSRSLCSSWSVVALNRDELGKYESLNIVTFLWQNRFEGRRYWSPLNEFSVVRRLAPRQQSHWHHLRVNSRLGGTAIENMRSGEWALLLVRREAEIEMGIASYQTVRLNQNGAKRSLLFTASHQPLTGSSRRWCCSSDVCSHSSALESRV